MSRRRLYADYLRDMLEAMDAVTRFTAGMTYEAFAADEKTVFAATRALEITGEAAKHIPHEIRDRWPEIPWRDMAGLRDVVIHEYHRVDLEVVWMAIKVRIPEVRAVIERALRDQEVREADA